MLNEKEIAGLKESYIDHIVTLVGLLADERNQLKEENTALKKAFLAKSTDPCSACKKQPVDGYCYDINDCIRGDAKNRKLWEFDIERFRESEGENGNDNS